MAANLHLLHLLLSHPVTLVLSPRVVMCQQAELEERAADASSAEEQTKRLSSEMASLQDQLRREKDRLTQVNPFSTEFKNGDSV